MAEQFADQEQPEERIARASVAIYASLGAFRATKRHEYAPRENTTMRELWSRGRLNLRHQRAWRAFCDDLHAWAGKSGKVTGSYGESTGGSGNAERMPTAYVSPEYARLQRFGALLIREESSLLRDLMTEELGGQKILDTETLGHLGNGYGNEAQARASGVTRIVCLLEKMGDFWQV